MDHSYSILSGTIGPNEPSPDYMLQLDNIICEFMREQDIPGASLCVHYCGKPLYKQGYGIARCGERVRSDSYFRIASISKTITAIGILRLVEKGLLTLDSKVFGTEGILAGFRCYHDHQTSITVLHLLQHSAGWDRELNGDHVFWYNDPVHHDKIDVFNSHTLVQYVLTHKLAFQPGTKHAYSNLTYLILGMVIEEIKEQPYEQYIDSILRPLGIDIYVGRALQEHCNQSREVKYFNNRTPRTMKSIFNDGCEMVPQYGSFPMENSGSYGGLVTCAENLVKIIESIILEFDHVPHILTPKSINMMMKEPSYSTSTDWYGLGIDIEDSGQSFGHTGAMDGTTTTVHHDKSGFTWALLFNSWANDMDLDGLMKYALSTVRGYSLWSKRSLGHKDCFHGDRCHGDCLLISQDGKQCVYIHVPHSKLMTHASKMKMKGYNVGYLSVSTIDHDIKFNVIWNETPRTRHVTWTLVLDVNQADLDDFMNKLNTNKQSVYLCQSYVKQDSIFHAFVVFDKEDVYQRIYCVDESEHTVNFQLYHDLGLTLVCQSVMTFKRTVYVTAVFKNLKPAMKDNTTNIMQEQWTSVPVEEFVPRLQEKSLQQFRLDHLQFYTLEGSIGACAIWTKMRISKSAFQRYIVYQRYNVSKYGLLYELRESMATNQPVKCLCSYMEEGVNYFVCIWGRYNRAKKKVFRQSYRKNKVPKR